LKNLLVIAFHFPPDNSSTGVLRTFKFTEYLLSHDWLSHVITAPAELYVSRNPTDTDKVPPQVTVERPWACDVKVTFGLRGIYPGWLGIPDRYWPWFFAARNAGARAIRTGGINAIYSTYPFPTAHLIGRSLKRRFKLPWIADFRDPWATDGNSGLAARIETRLERSVVRLADRVICNTPAMRRDFLSRYPEVSPTKFVTITNGYDEKDFASIIPLKSPKFNIFYPGTIDLENRNPRGLFAGIRLALDRGWLAQTDLQLTFLGCGPYGDSASFRDDVTKYSLHQFIEIVKERIPYRDALARMAGADVLVVLSENLSNAEAAQNIERWTAMQVPAKLYEYLRIGRPLLALVGEGAVRELLEDTGAGLPISSRNTEEIALALQRLDEARNAGRIATDPANVSITKYSRESLTALLARELDSLVAGT
jgi:glycosyltransferase involved in cell wall biosynthesis